MENHERYEDQVLRLGWPRLAQGFATLLALIGVSAAVGLEHLPESLRRQVMKRLRPLEIYARRLLVIEALRLNPTPQKSNKIIGERSVSSMVNKDGTYRSQFSLIESYPSTTPYHLRRKICLKRPRIRSLDEVFPPSEPAPQRPDRALKRLRALESLLDDSKPAANRLARWFTRRRRGLRRCPLKLGRCGVNRRHELRNYIVYADIIAREAIDRQPWPPD